MNLAPFHFWSLLIIFSFSGMYIHSPFTFFGGSWNPAWQTEPNIISPAFWGKCHLERWHLYNENFKLLQMQGCICYSNAQASVKCLLHGWYLIPTMRLIFCWYNLLNRFKTSVYIRYNCLLNKLTQPSLSATWNCSCSEGAWQENRVHHQMLTEPTGDFWSRDVNCRWATFEGIG